MKLVCPSCAAEYKVAAAAVGDRGRMVRCSSCGAEWFQAAGQDDEPVEVETEVAAPPAVEAPQPIVEETGMALPPVAEEAPDPGYRIVADEPEAQDQAIYFDPEPDPEPAEVEETQVRRRREEERDELAASLADLNAAPGGSSGGAFLAGFSTVAVLAVVALGVYVKAGDLALIAPAAEPILETYTGFVDQGRLALANFIG